MSGHLNKIYYFLIMLAVFYPAPAWAAERHFPAPDPENTSCDYAGYLEIDTNLADPGDEIAFFTAAGEIKGNFVLTSYDGKYGFLHVYGGEGIYEGALLNVRVWDESTGIEYHGSTIMLSPIDLGGYSQPSLIPPVWHDGFTFALEIQVETKGDINGDGQINLSDVVVALRIISDLPVDGICILQKSSVVGEKIGINDAVFILQKTAGVRGGLNP